MGGKVSGLMVWERRIGRAEGIEGGREGRKEKDGELGGGNVWLDVPRTEVMTAMQGFSTAWFGRRTRSFLRGGKRGGAVRVETPLGAMVVRVERTSDGLRSDSGCGAAEVGMQIVEGDGLASTQHRPNRVTWAKANSRVEAR